MMIFKYPYTNLYNLNLDWIIQAIKEMQETIGPLDNIVNTFNDRTGNVELTAEDVNATLIDIVWTSDPGETVHDLTQTQIDQMYASGKRILIFVNNLGVADQVYFLQWYDNHAMPQEYTPTSALAGVASFNGMTGNVVATGDNIATSATDTDTIAESLAEKVPVTRTVNGQPLSINVDLDADDIPSGAISGATTVEMALGNLNASKVPNARTVNGKSLLNNIVLDDADIPSNVDGKTNVEAVLEDHSDRIADVESEIDAVKAATAYVEEGDTATQKTYAAGEFILWKGALYTVNSGGIPVNTAITGHVTAVTGGGLNALNTAVGMCPRMKTFVLTQAQGIETATTEISFTPPTGVTNDDVKLLLLYTEYDNVFFQWRPQSSDHRMNLVTTWAFNVINRRGATVGINKFYATVLY